MSAAITLNPSEIQQISQPIAVSSSRLRVLARKAEALAGAVERGWEEFSPEERELLEAGIYSLIAEKGGTKSWLFSLRARLSLAWILPRREIDSLTEYLKAVMPLKNAVLAAIEREQPAYQEKVTEALEESLSESDSSPAMTPEQFREWLTKISD